MSLIKKAAESMDTCAKLCTEIKLKRISSLFGMGAKIRIRNQEIGGRR